MSAAVESQAGAAVSFGVTSESGATLTWAGVTDLTMAVASGKGANISEQTVGKNFKVTELPSQNGAVIETLIASQCYRDYECTFVPKGTTRALAQAVANALMTATPLTVITVTHSPITAIGGETPTSNTFNYIGGAYVKETREGYCVAGIKLRSFETAAAANTYAALSVI
jgi:hypothetical protein